MRQQQSYGATAKFFHWTIVGLLSFQYLLGWLMPDIKRGMTPGTAMSVHLSVGISILALGCARYLWRLAHPVQPAPELSLWQRVIAEGVHLLLYGLLLVTTASGWVFASMRGWTIWLFGIVPLPSLVAEGSEIGRAIGRLHGTLSWVLLAVIAAHVGAALLHALWYRDGVMRRMFPRFHPVRDLG